MTKITYKQYEVVLGKKGSFIRLKNGSKIPFSAENIHLILDDNK